MNNCISVIVPVYKVEKYLRKCVDSILAQTYTNLEIILVDDGSPDNCGKICDEYAAKDSRIKVIHQQNGGLSAARNAGLDIATGDFIGFVDSDDYIAPEMYERLLSSLQMVNAEISVCNFQKVDEFGDIISTTERVENSSLTNREILHKLQEENGICYVIVCNKIFLKDLFEGVRFPEGKKCEDNFIIHRIYYSCNLIVTIDSVLYYYVQRANSIMNNMLSYGCFDEIEGFLARLHFYNDNNLPEFLLETKKSVVCSFKRQYCYSINNKEKRVQLIKQYYILVKSIYSEIKRKCDWKTRLFFECRPVYMLLFKVKQLLKKTEM